MFLTTEELKSVAYEYQLNEIVEEDEDIPVMAIGAAINEMKSYLRPNKDSIERYDVEAIFGATGSSRDPLILELCKSIALWYIIRLSNVDILEEKITNRYKRAIEWLEKVSGTGQYAGTPQISPDLPELPDDDDVSNLPFRFGSRVKFNHE